MAKTVDEAFRTFHQRLTPSGTQTEAAKSHRASIEACLHSNFQITRFFQSGSFGNGTTVRGYSDVDRFASIPPDAQRQNSATMLQLVCQTLENRFPKSGVRIDSPAVMVPFGVDVSERTEVIPAYFVRREKEGHQTYKIADGTGGWLLTNPDTHNAYVAGVNDSMGNRVKPLIRFLKAWKFMRDVPIASFYLELRVAKYAASEQSIVYSIDVKRVLKTLWDNQLAALQDPVGISGYIQPCATKGQKEDALNALALALERAEKARTAEMEDRIEAAFYWWDRVFAGNFPTYG